MIAKPEVSRSPKPAGVRSVQRALNVLRALVGNGSRPLAEIAAETGLDKATARRLLLTLMQEDFVHQDPVSQTYRLGRGIRELARSVEDTLDLKSIAHPVLLELSSDLGVTTFLSVFRDQSAVCLDRVHDMRGIEVHWWSIGGTLPLNCGGAPKLFLAYQPNDVVERIVADGLSGMSDKSITDHETLKARLALIRKRGWELAVDDVVEGLSALAAPVLDDEGQPICVISIAGLTPQMTSRGKPAHLERLQQATGRVRNALSSE